MTWTLLLNFFLILVSNERPCRRQKLARVPEFKRRFLKLTVEVLLPSRDQLLNLICDWTCTSVNIGHDCNRYFLIQINIQFRVKTNEPPPCPTTRPLGVSLIWNPNP